MIHIDFRGIVTLLVTALVHLGSVAATPMVSAGANHTCALQASGAIRCWGTNGSGQLGNGGTASSSIPVLVIGIETAISVAAGVAHTCAVLGSGGVKCWGANYYGQLSNGSTTSSSVPALVNGVSGATSVVAGSNHTCALTASGAVQCWGYNAQGQLGDGNVNNAIVVTAGDIHTCAVIMGGTVKCWGGNTSGQLGNGTTTNSFNGVMVSGISTAVAVSGGQTHTCAVLSNGAVQCWGSNFSGELGNASTLASTSPVPVNGINSAVLVSVAGAWEGISNRISNHSCAVLSSGSIKCWGGNAFGELGNGSTNYSSTAVPVIGINAASAVSAGNGHNCVLLNSGAVQCWGYNYHGQLGTAGPNATSPLTLSNVNLALPDTIPSTFSFIAQTGITPAALVLSNIVTVQDVTSATEISIQGGEYAINGSGFNSGSGTVVLGDEVQVRLTASSSYSTSSNAILTIGGVSSMFVVTTKPTDTTPDSFSFTAQSGLLPGSVVTSNAITVQGINFAAPISIAGGEYSINGGTFANNSATVMPGSEIRVRITSPVTYSTSASATLTIGGVAAVFKAINGPVFSGSKDCIFNWMEDHYTVFMTPSRPASVVSGDVTYRYYSGAESFVGVSSQDSHLYFLSNLTGLLDLGLATTWSTKAGCQ